MPEWIEQLLIRFFGAHGFALDSHELSEHYLKIDLVSDGQLEVNFIPDEERLILSMRLTHRLENEYLQQVLRLNHYCLQRPLSPTGHLFDNAIVLRSVIKRDELDQVSLERAFETLRNTNARVAGR